MSELKNFVNFHVLISHSPSCLNRDDQNMQKRAVFGGVERTRISSQSLKRAMRTSDYYKSEFDRSTRTRLLLNELAEKLVATLPDKKQDIEKAACYIAAIVEGKEKPEDIKKFKQNEKSGRIEHQTLPFHKAEIDQIEKLLKQSVEKEESGRINFIKTAIKAMETEESKRITLDVALSGRMAPSSLIYNIDGALSVAHAITTHAAQADMDWFTAVDDLVQDSGEVGAGHLDTQEFSSGVFYRYASLNIAQLQKNLGGATRERALEIAKHVFHMLCTVVPSAKQQSFAAHNLADFAIVTFDDQPISMANAFEQPTEKEKNGGYLKPSVSALAAYFIRMKEVYGLGGLSVGSPKDISAVIPDDLIMLPSFPEVETWVANDGKKD